MRRVGCERGWWGSSSRGLFVPSKCLQQLFVRRHEWRCMTGRAAMRRKLPNQAATATAVLLRRRQKVGDELVRGCHRTQLIWSLLYEQQIKCSVSGSMLSTTLSLQRLPHFFISIGIEQRTWLKFSDLHDVVLIKSIDDTKIYSRLKVCQHGTHLLAFLFNTIYSLEMLLQTALKCEDVFVKLFKTTASITCIFIYFVKHQKLTVCKSLLAIYSRPEGGENRVCLTAIIHHATYSEGW